MDFFSHIFWVWLPTKNKLWRDEAIFFAILPDLGFGLILLYVFVGTPMNVGFGQAVETMPSIYFQIYYFLHSFVALGLVALIFWRLRPKLLSALSGWFVHIMLDIPFHEGPDFATRFLYPVVSDLYVAGISWFDWRILAISYLSLVICYLYMNHRETMKMRLNSAWKPDIFDKINRWGESLISKKKITAADEAGDIEGTPGGLSGQDENGAGEIENSAAGEVVDAEIG